MNLVIFDKFIDHYVLKCGVIPFAFCLTVCPIAGFLSDIASRSSLSDLLVQPILSPFF